MSVKVHRGACLALALLLWLASAAPGYGSSGSRPGSESPQPSVVVRVTGGGFRWQDAGLGATAALAAGLIVAGLTLTLRQARRK